MSAITNDIDIATRPDGERRGDQSSRKKKKTGKTTTKKNTHNKEPVRRHTRSLKARSTSGSSESPARTTGLSLPRQAKLRTTEFRRRMILRLATSARTRITSSRQDTIAQGTDRPTQPSGQGCAAQAPEIPTNSTRGGSRDNIVIRTAGLDQTDAPTHKKQVGRRGCWQ